MTEVEDGSAPHGDRYAALATLIAESPHNLMSRRERETVLGVHIPECRGVAAALAPAAGSRWVDLGTGGGLPGLVLAIERPDVEWTLVDSTTKKVQAVDGFARALGLDNVLVVAGRAEQLARSSTHRGVYDGVVSRALARLAVAAELSRGFVRGEGTVAFVKGPRWRDELASAASALPLLGLRDVHTHDIPGAVRPTVVVTMRADGPPPAPYPRRDGIPATQPLGR